jgi:hypothetical protein
MTTKDINELAGKLIEYNIELTQREIEATKKEDWAKMSRILDIKNYISWILEALDEEEN